MAGSLKKPTKLTDLYIKKKRGKKILTNNRF